MGRRIKVGDMYTFRLGEGPLYHRGEQRVCTYEECKDLEILAVWDENHLIDRIMGDSKWQDSFKKPVICWRSTVMCRGYWTKRVEEMIKLKIYFYIVN